MSTLSADHLARQIDFHRLAPRVQQLLQEVLADSSWAINHRNGRDYIQGIATVSPEQAKVALDRFFTRNRNEIVTATRKLEEDMKAGEFRFNGENVIFDENANIRDGHHRLMACSNGDVPIETSFIIGIPSAAFSSMDQGCVRRLEDILQMMEEDHHRTLATCVTFIAGFKEDGRIKRINNTRATSTRRALLSLFAAHQDGLRRAACFAEEIGRDSSSRVGGIGQLAALHYILGQVDLKAAETLLLGLTKNAGFGAAAEDDGAFDRWQPARILFNTLAKFQASNVDVSAQVIAACIVKAWNLMRKNRCVKTKSYTHDLAEPFPQVAGWAYDKENDCPTGPVKGASDGQ